MNPIIEIFKAAESMNDRDQRSALGIADSFARGSVMNLDGARVVDGKPNRDALAVAIIRVVADLNKEKSYKVRHEARDWLDAPYRNDPKLLAWREGRGGAIGLKDR